MLQSRPRRGEVQDVRNNLSLTARMIENSYNGGPIGPPAMINCELRQARKGATVTIDSCAGMWLVGLPPLFFNSAHHKKLPFLRSKILTYISMRTFFALNLLPRTACMQNLQEQNFVKPFCVNLI